MPWKQDAADAINSALQGWRQGDISLNNGPGLLHLADLSRPHRPASRQAASTLTANETQQGNNIVPVPDEVPGLALLSQTCDLMRDCEERPYMEAAPLVQVSEGEVEDIRRLRRPAFAYLPATARQRLVVDLDRTMTVAKSLVAEWPRTQGLSTDVERRDFAHALARKRARCAFPDAFVLAARALQKTPRQQTRQADSGRRPSQRLACNPCSRSAVLGQPTGSA